LPFKWNYWT